MKRIIRSLAIVFTIAPLSVLAQALNSTSPQQTRADGSREVASPREILQLFDLDDSVLRFFRDGEALSDDKMEPVYRILYLLPRFDGLQRHR